ncbi:MAG: indole-3-glycerol phosphate synthase TrpC [Rickettsiales bacterium]
MADTNILDEICARKYAHIAGQKLRIPEAVLEKALENVQPARGFHAALKNKVSADGIGLIAEIKKASPSKGVIREDFDPEKLAIAYAAGGAACLSVLTDVPYFQGDDAYLAEARNAVTLPVLRKDFILDPYQVKEARVIGADCILLIMAALKDEEAKTLESLAHSYGMDVLVEVHDQQELERALAQLSSHLVGINNRNLKTLEIDLNTTKALVPLIPAEYTIVCESGISTPAEIAGMRALGVHCFLIGESLMRAENVTEATKKLLDSRR